MARVPSQLRRDLRICTIDGMCYTLMLGLGQEYFAKLAVLLGLGDAAVGLIEPIPMLLATLVQQFAVLLVIWTGSYRRVVWVSAAIQAVLLFPLAGLALWASGRPEAPAPTGLQLLLFGLISAYYIGAFAGGPSWMALLGLVFPDRVMPRYFGRRTLLLHLVLILGLLAGGWALQSAAAHGSPAVLRVLALMFTAAGLARIGSAYFLSRYREPAFEPPVVVSIPEVVRRVRSGPDGRALTFLVLLQAAAWVGFPFFRPYMLKQIGPAGADDSFLYSSLLGAFWVGKMIAPEFAGRAVHRFGLLRVTWFSAAALVPVPALWLFSHDRPYLLAAQFISGAALASFELCSLLLQMEHVPTRERASVLATFGLALYAAGLLGSLAGGFLLGNDAATSDYARVFIISCVLRLASLALLARVGPSGPEMTTLGPLQDPGGESLTISVVQNR